jgi:hypothetical protein
MLFAQVPSCEALPYTPAPAAEESLSSYCWRALKLHGLSVSWLKTKLHLPQKSTVHELSAAALLSVFRMDPAWLSRRAAGRRAGRFKGREFMGHELMFPSQLRLRWPQICPVCWHDSGYGRLGWDISLATACPAHGVQLVDCCIKCTAAFTWNGMRLLSCRCARAMKTCETAHAAEVALSRHIEQRLLSPHSPYSHHSCDEWPAWINTLTLNGVLGVVHALGERERPFEKGSGSALVRARNAAEWRSVVLRARARLAEIQDPYSPARSLAPYVSETILQKMIERCAKASDAHIARVLLASIFGNTKRASAHHSDKQLALF